jgi:hypothetical protein
MYAEHRRAYEADPAKAIARATAWNKAHPERRREIMARTYARPGIETIRRRYHMKSNFGLTLEDFDRMLEQQNGVCAICEKECPTGQRLGVDHDHVTGKIRGLLCRKCNSGIGQFGDSLDLVKKALAYLEASAA